MAAINNIILSAINEYERNYSYLKQIIFYPYISTDLTGMVSEVFPEFDINNETPLLFFNDSDSYYMGKWLMLSDAGLYYYMHYFPYPFDVIDFMPLSKINTFKTVPRLWPKYEYIEINGKRVFTIYTKEKIESKIISDFINLVLEHKEYNCILTADECQTESEDNLENGKLFEIAEKYFNEVNLGGRAWGFEYFHYGPFISDEKLQQARTEYADYDLDKEKPIIYYDNSWAGHFKIDSSGFLITNKYFYYKLEKSMHDKKYDVGKIPLSSIKKFQVLSRFKGWIIINGGKWKFMLTWFFIYNRREAKIFEELMQKFIQTLGN